MADLTGALSGVLQGNKAVGCALSCVSTAIPNAVTKVKFSELKDTHGFFDSATSQTDIVIPAGYDGSYLILCTYQFNQTVSAGVTQTLINYIYKNAQIAGQQHEYTFAVGGGLFCGVDTWTWLPDLVAGDVITARGWRSSNVGTCNAVSAGAGSDFLMIKLDLS